MSCHDSRDSHHCKTPVAAQCMPVAPAPSDTSSSGYLCSPAMGKRPRPRRGELVVADARAAPQPSTGYGCRAWVEPGSGADGDLIVNRGDAGYRPQSLDLSSYAPISRQLSSGPFLTDAAGWCDPAWWMGSPGRSWHEGPIHRDQRFCSGRSASAALLAGKTEEPSGSLVRGVPARPGEVATHRLVVVQPPAELVRQPAQVNG